MHLVHPVLWPWPCILQVRNLSQPVPTIVLTLRFSAVYMYTVTKIICGHCHEKSFGYTHKRKIICINGHNKSSMYTVTEDHLYPLTKISCRTILKDHLYTLYTNTVRIDHQCYTVTQEELIHGHKRSSVYIIIIIIFAYTVMKNHLHTLWQKLSVYKITKNHQYTLSRVISYILYTVTKLGCVHCHKRSSVYSITKDQLYTLWHKSFMHTVTTDYLYILSLRAFVCIHC
jgi:hypothetical protein